MIQGGWGGGGGGMHAVASEKRTIKVALHELVAGLAFESFKVASTFACDD